MRGPPDDFVGAPEGRRPRMTQKFCAPRPNAAPPERFRRARFRAACSLASASLGHAGTEPVHAYQRWTPRPHVAARGRDHAHRAPQPVTKPPPCPQNPPSSRPRRPLEPTRSTPEPLWTAVSSGSDTGSPWGWLGAAQAGPRSRREAAEPQTPSQNLGLGKKSGVYFMYMYM